MNFARMVEGHLNYLSQTTQSFFVRQMLLR